jgi:hypothetical protein
MSDSPARPTSLGRGSVASRNRLTLSDALSFDEWCAIGARITGIADASAWWLGDWLFYGQWQYGKKYIKAVEITGYDEGTLRNYSSVAGRFDLSRRRDKLSFGHHQVVVSLPLNDADRFLAQAEKGSWSIRRLRDEIKATKAVAPAPPELGPADAPIPPESVQRAAEAPPLATTLHFDVSVTRMRSWAAAAAAHGKSIADWATETLDAAAAAVATT